MDHSKAIGRIREKVKSYKKLVKRILTTYIEEETKFKESDPSLGDKAYDALMKKTKGRVIDRFLSQKVVSIPVEKLIKTHRGAFYSLQDMLWKIDDKEPINVIKNNGQYLVMDGHHRILMHKILGKKTIKCRLVNLDTKKRKRKKKK